MPFTKDDRLLLHRLTRPERSVRIVDDAHLVGLVTAAQAGHQQAGEQVLSVLAFGLAQMARSSHADTLADYVSAAWLVITRFNCQRASKVETNLLLDTLKQVTRDRVSRWDDHVEPHPAPDLIGGPGVATTPDQARRVLDEARREGLVDALTLKVLDAVYVEGLSGREAAARFNSTPEMIRYRCSRGVRQMRHYHHHLADLIS